MHKTQIKIRKIHRYLGLAIGIQFIMWTLSGLYFSWTDLDEIHGDPYLNEGYQALDLIHYFQQTAWELTFKAWS